MNEVGTLSPELAAARLMALARRATARLPRLAGQTPEGLAAAVAAVRSVVAELWSQVPPEAARAAILMATSTARLNGVISPPAIAGMSPGELGAVERMLALADEWFIADRHAAQDWTRPSLDQAAAPRAFATSLAFDRNYDQETLVTLSVLLALAGVAIPLPARRGGLWLE